MKKKLYCSLVFLYVISSFPSVYAKEKIGMEEEKGARIFASVKTELKEGNTSSGIFEILNDAKDLFLKTLENKKNVGK